MNTSSSISKRIKQARENANLSKSALAREVGVSHTAVGLWENGETKNVLAKHLLLIAKATKTDPDYLITGKHRKHGETTNVNEPAANYEVLSAYSTRTLRMLEKINTLEALDDTVTEGMESQLDMWIASLEKKPR